MEDVVEALGGRRRIKQAGMSGLQVLSGSGSGSGCWGKVLPYHPSHLSPPREVFSGSTPSWQEAATHSPSTHSGTLCWVGLFTQKSGQKSFMRGVYICGGGVGGSFARSFSWDDAKKANTTERDSEKSKPTPDSGRGRMVFSWLSPSLDLFLKHRALHLNSLAPPQFHFPERLFLAALSTCLFPWLF